MACCPAGAHGELHVEYTPKGMTSTSIMAIEHPCLVQNITPRRDAAFFCFPCSHTLTHTHTHTLAHARAHTHTTHTHTHTQTHTHTHTVHAGELVDLDGVPCYVVGQGGKALIVAHDIFGMDSGRTKAICDRLSSELNVMVSA
jgi:hypothetical protein